MYINKVVFADFEEVEPLEEFGIVSYTDYNTIEILPDIVQEKVKEYPDLTSELKKQLGEELANALLNSEIDFVLVA